MTGTKYADPRVVLSLLVPTLRECPQRFSCYLARHLSTMGYSVPHLAELKASCAEQIATYRQCLERHASQPDEVISENCGGLMKTLWECTERAVTDIEKREAGEKKLV